MKDIIKNKLRALLAEAESHTPSNPISGTEPKVATYNDLERIIYRVVNAQKNMVISNNRRFHI